MVGVSASLDLGLPGFIFILSYFQSAHMLFLLFPIYSLDFSAFSVIPNTGFLS